MIEGCHIIRRRGLLRVKEGIIAFGCRHDCIAGQWRRRLGPGKLRGDGSIVGAVGVVRLAVHLIVLCNAPLPRLSTDEGASHSTCYDSTRDDNDSSSQYYPSSPSDMWNEQQDVDEESEQRDQKGGEGEYQ